MIATKTLAHIGVLIDAFYRHFPMRFWPQNNQMKYCRICKKKTLKLRGKINFKTAPMLEFILRERAIRMIKNQIISFEKRVRTLKRKVNWNIKIFYTYRNYNFMLIVVKQNWIILTKIKLQRLSHYIDLNSLNGSSLVHFYFFQKRKKQKQLISVI